MRQSESTADPVRRCSGPLRFRQNLASGVTMPARVSERGVQHCRRAQLRNRAAIAAVGAIALRAISAVAQTASTPEAVLITARPPDPVGNAAFSTVFIDANQLQATPKLDAALREVPGISNFRDIS